MRRPVAHSAETLLAEAVEIQDPAERTRFLDRACGADTDLRRSVQSLIDDFLAADGLLQPPLLAAGTFSLDAVSETAVQIEHFKIREMIGQGGMGIVYIADQLSPVARRVALKVIKPGMDSQQVVARFESERQALALMDHPYIAKVLGGGETKDGRPYFVMELVKGASITEFCESRELSQRDRLRLFVKVCSAVEHAHQKGIIHRDLKPSNILVAMHDDAPTPKIIDFGIAKAMSRSLSERTVYTAFAQLIGTPLYMSPEQAELNNVDIDTRSDVYSLGVVMYELLTGCTPFDSGSLKRASFDEVRRIIREDEPQRPSERVSTMAAKQDETLRNKGAADLRRLSELLRGELDWIVLKALEKDRGRRYQSARELADDIRRYLDDEPVSACPPTLAYRCSKLLRRHRAAALTIGLVSAALLLGAVASFWQAVRARESERHAQARGRLAREAVDEMYTEVAEEWLANQGSLSDVQVTFLNKALAYYEEFADEKHTDPRLQYEALQALERVCVIQDRLGRHSAAESSCRRLTARCTTLSEQYPDIPEFKVALMNAHGILSSVLRSVGKTDEAKKNVDMANTAALPLYDATIHDAELRERLAGRLNYLGTHLNRFDRVAEAERAIRHSLRLWRSLLEENPNSWDYRLGRAIAQYGLGALVCQRRPDDPATEVDVQEAEDMFNALASERPTSRIARDLQQSAATNLAGVVLRRGRYAEALELFRRSLTVSERLAAEFPNDRHLQESLGISLHNMQLTLGHMDNVEHAAEVRRLRHQYLSVYENLVRQFPETLEYQFRYGYDASVSIGDEYSDGNLDAARRIAESAVRVMSECPPNREWRLSRALLFQTAAALHADLHDHEQAVRCLQALPAQFRAFQSKAPTATYSNDPVELAHFYEEQFSTLLRPVAILMECKRLMERDQSSSFAEREASLEECRRLTAEFQTQADMALTTWASLVCQSDEHFATCMRRLHFETAYVADRDPIHTPLLRRFNRESLTILFRALICKRAQSRDTDRNPSDGLLYSLTAGSDEQRDPLLALKAARRQLDMLPNDVSHQRDLAWALYRNGQWSECYQACSEVLARQGEPGDAMIEVVLTTALWHLGRLDEARLWDGESSLKALKNYVEAWKQRPSVHGQLPFPTISVLEQLGHEPKVGFATESLACNLTSLQDVDDASELVTTPREELSPEKWREMTLRYWENTLSNRRERLGSRHPATLRASYVLGQRYFDDGQIEAGLELIAPPCTEAKTATDELILVAALQAWFGRRAELQATQARALRHAEGTQDAAAAEKAAKVCSIVASTDSKQREATVALAQKALELVKYDRFGWFQMTLGMAQYRNGQYANAMTSLAAAEKFHANRYVVATAAFYRAMCLCQLGKRDEAVILIEKTAATHMEALPVDVTLPRNSRSRLDHDDIICWLAYQEAKELAQMNSLTRN